MPKVYVTQIPNRRDKNTGALVPSFDIMPAHEHGDVVVLMPSTTSVFATADVIKHLRNGLARYDYVGGDFIIAAGDPAIIFAAGAILGEQHNKARLLKWERELRRYIAVEMSL